MLYEISSAMNFLHQKKIIHRDLKLKNVLVTKREEIKLMDFGFSKLIFEESTKTKKVGTSFYMAPEVLSGHYSFPCDIYSFAMLSFVVLTENFIPLNQKNEQSVFNKIMNNSKLKPKIELIDDLEMKNENKKIIKNLISQNWEMDPTKRMNFQQTTNILQRIHHLNERRNQEEKENCQSLQKEDILLLKKENENLRRIVEQQRKELMIFKEKMIDN